jgi:hypothetical protein
MVLNGDESKADHTINCHTNAEESIGKLINIA